MTGTGNVPAASGEEPGAPVAGLPSLAAVQVAVAVAAQVELEALSDTDLDGLLAGLRRPLTQLEGVRARAAAVQQRRRLQARGTGASIDATLTEHRRALGRQQRLAPGDVGRVLDAGRAAAQGTVTGRAVTDGRISVAHARIIGRVLAALVGDQRAEVEVELVDLAEGLDPVGFGRAARAVQGRVQPEVLAGVQRRQEFDRRFRATDTEDGGFAFSGLLYGGAAETARAAVQAFRRPDAVGERRTPQQRGADAFEQLCATALEAGDAPTRHGVRPQVMVTIGAADLALLDEHPDQAVGTFVGSGQPIAGAELRHLLADCKLLRVVLDAQQVPIAVSTTVRTVPAGLWRALLIRDRGCTWPGCDAPASWCDVAHATTPFAADGKLSLDNAMLLCRRHHRTYDTSNLTVSMDGPNITYPALDPGPDPRPGDLNPGPDPRPGDPSPGPDPGPDRPPPDRPDPDRPPLDRPRTGRPRPGRPARNGSASPRGRPTQRSFLDDG